MSQGAGIGATRSRDPLAGCDRGADHERVVFMPILCASSGSDPKGSLFRPPTRLIPHPRPLSRRGKGGLSFLSPFGREVRSEGTGDATKANEPAADNCCSGLARDFEEAAIMSSRMTLRRRPS